MHEPAAPCSIRAGERGVAPVLLLFALSAFTVLSIGALTTRLGSAAAGQTFAIFRTLQQDALTNYLAHIVVPNDWRAPGAAGSYQFQLPVVVPESASADGSASSAWHAMTEIPGMAVCCEASAGVCARRDEASGGARIIEWNPGTDDALWLSFDLASRAAATADAGKGDLVTATVSTPDSSAPPEGSLVSCQLEFDGAVIAKGRAHLRQVPRQDGTLGGGEAVAGTITVAVKTK